MQRIYDDKDENNEVVWQCNECPYYNGNPKAIAAHIGQRHSILPYGENTQKLSADQKFTCPYCDKGYTGLTNLKNHIFCLGCGSLFENLKDGPQIWNDIRS